MRKTKNVKRVFIAATQQNDGKTTVSLGIIEALKKRGKVSGFIKPIGQRYLIESGFKVDEDSILIGKRCGINARLKDMSPIAIERGFTERYIMSGNKTMLVKAIKRSFVKISKGRDFVVIEGTGHAGVGSCFDMSNAFVARLLRSKVIIVSSGGIGRPIDEVMLNKALFDKKGVEIAGVIVNKVLPEKYDKINKLVRRGLERRGLRVLGVLPYQKVLAAPSIGEIADELGLKYVCGERGRENMVNKVIVGAMEPHEAWNYIEDSSLVITPGDREDMVLMAMSSHLLMTKREAPIAGIVLTGGIRPNRRICRLMERTGIPVLMSGKDTYAITSDIHDLTVKIRPSDEHKAEMAIGLVEQHIDIDRLMKIIA